MKSWEELVSAAKDLATAAGRKASDVADMAKLKLKLVENEKATDATLTAVGRLVFEAHRNKTQPEKELMDELLQQADELFAAGERLQEELDSQRGRKSCVSCGAANPMDAEYCNRCGKAL